MESSEQIIDAISKLIAGESPNIFSSKLFKKAAKHPKIYRLKEITNEILEVSNDFDLDPEDKIKQLRELSLKLKQIWSN